MIVPQFNYIIFVQLLLSINTHLIFTSKKGINASITAGNLRCQFSPYIYHS